MNINFSGEVFVSKDKGNIPERAARFALYTIGTAGLLALSGVLGSALYFATGGDDIAPDPSWGVASYQGEAT